MVGVDEVVIAVDAVIMGAVMVLLYVLLLL